MKGKSSKSEEMARYLAIVPLERYGKRHLPGAWVRLEVETGELLASKGFALPESALDTDKPDDALLKALANSGACFAPGVLANVKRTLGISAGWARLAAYHHLGEKLRQVGKASALLGSVTMEDLKRWK